MQNAFCNKEGSYQKRGNALLNLDLVIRNISILLNYFRSAERPIVFTKQCFKSDYSDIGLLRKLHPEIIHLNGLKADTWDTEIIKELKPLPSESVLVKKTYDPFYNTFLESLLKEKEINRLVVCGVVANICVQATLISAFVRGIEPILVRECTTSTSKLLLDALYENAINSFGWIKSIESLLTVENSTELKERRTE